MKVQIYKIVKLLLLALLFSLSATAQEKRSVVFRNVTLIDMRSEQTRPDMSVLVSGNRIAKIGKNIKIPKDAQVVDASGKFMIPGLWDMYVFLFDNRDAPDAIHTDDYFPLSIANGVTGVRDMWTDADDIKLVRRWQKEIEAGKMIGPRVAVGSRIVDGVPLMHKNSLGVGSPDEARQTVRILRDGGAGFIRIYANLSRESYFAIADEAKKLKIPFAGLVPNSVTPVGASNAGQKSIEHLTRMFIACSTKEDKFKNFSEQDWTAALFLEMMESFSEQKCREVGAEHIYPGFSLHDELETFVQAGLTPFETLKTATVNPAKYLGMEKSLGTIEKGKFADLVLLDANPLTDISNTKKINTVVVNGRLLDKKTLGDMLRKVEAEAKKK